MDQQTRGWLLRGGVLLALVVGGFLVTFADFLITSIGVVLIIIGLMSLMLVVVNFFNSHDRSVQAAS